MSSTKKHFYITTTLPYVNSDPHVGFTLELIRADAIARSKKAQGFEVFFNTGTDEHGQKIYDKAKEQGTPTQAYVDGYAERFKGLIPLLGLSSDIHFIRTTDSHHKAAAQEFWRRCQAKGDIYKKNYQTKYCVGCELEKTDSELVDGKCPIHPTMTIELINEENYFFRFSAYQKKLLDLYPTNPKLVIPDFRFNEIKAFVERGLEDFSISRLKSKMAWGVAVPDDADQVMYVWFDALVNYISTLGWPENTTQFDNFWAHGTPTQYCGKDNLRQQSAMWQAMLMSASLPPTHTIIIDGFVTGAGGVKMSKSLGNVINPYDVVRDYSTDALRYFALREVSPFEDSPFTAELFKEAYNANLANGLGNLVSRVMKMAISYNVDLTDLPKLFEHEIKDIPKHIANFELNKAMDDIWKLIGQLDAYIQKEQPFKKIKVDEVNAHIDIRRLLSGLATIATVLEPFLPATATAIHDCLNNKKVPESPLFLRKE